MSIPIVPGYHGLEKIGAGGFGAVYRATQTSVGREVALKLLHRATADEDTERRFQRECRVVGSLSWHPHIAAVHDAGADADGHPYLAFELLTGGSLGDRLKEVGSIPWSEAVVFAIQMADALAAAHDVDVLHRDVKPDNILIDRLGRAKLADFGIAQMHDGHQTRSGVITATLAHVAPEVLNGARATEISDTYLLGSTLFELVAGEPPFGRVAGGEVFAAIQRIANEKAPRLDQRGIAGVPKALADVVERTLRKEPQERYGSAAEFGLALRAAQQAGNRPLTAMPFVAATGGMPADETAPPDTAPPGTAPRDTASPAAPPPPPNGTAGDVRPPPSVGGQSSTPAPDGPAPASAGGLSEPPPTPDGAAGGVRPPPPGAGQSQSSPPPPSAPPPPPPAAGQSQSSPPRPPPPPGGPAPASRGGPPPPPDGTASGVHPPPAAPGGPAPASGVGQPVSPSPSTSSGDAVAPPPRFANQSAPGPPGPADDVRRPPPDQPVSQPAPPAQDRPGSAPPPAASQPIPPPDGSEPPAKRKPAAVFAGIAVLVAACVGGIFALRVLLANDPTIVPGVSPTSVPTQVPTGQIEPTARPQNPTSQPESPTATPRPTTPTTVPVPTSLVATDFGIAGIGFGADLDVAVDEVSLVLGRPDSIEESAFDGLTYARWPDGFSLYSGDGSTFDGWEMFGDFHPDIEIEGLAGPIRGLTFGEEPAGRRMFWPGAPASELLPTLRWLGSGIEVEWKPRSGVDLPEEPQTLSELPELELFKIRSGSDTGIFSQGQAVVNANGVNVRLNPSTSAPVIGVAFRGDRYDIAITVFRDGRNWTAVIPEDENLFGGWMATEFLDDG